MVSDDHGREEQVDDRTYEPPEMEPIGSADELAQGNEGSKSDATTVS